MKSITAAFPRERPNINIASIAKALKPKINYKSASKNMIISLVSILLFVLLWHLGSKALYNIEAESRIATVLAEQGAAEADKLKTCIASGDISCQPNTLPTPLQVWTASQALLADHFAINKKKEAFLAEVSATNKGRKASGLAPIKYTGRPCLLYTSDAADE